LFCILQNIAVTNAAQFSKIYYVPTTFYLVSFPPHLFVRWPCCCYRF